jgi:hypothetical protein
LLSAVSQLEQSNGQFETAAGRAWDSKNASEDKQNLSNALLNVTSLFSLIPIFIIFCFFVIYICYCTQAS